MAEPISDPPISPSDPSESGGPGGGNPGDPSPPSPPPSGPLNSLRGSGGAVQGTDGALLGSTEPCDCECGQAQPCACASDPSIVLPPCCCLDPEDPEYCGGDAQCTDPCVSTASVCCEQGYTGCVYTLDGVTVPTWSWTLSLDVDYDICSCLPRRPLRVTESWDGAATIPVASLPNCGSVNGSFSTPNGVRNTPTCAGGSQQTSLLAIVVSFAFSVNQLGQTVPTSQFAIQTPYFDAGAVFTGGAWQAFQTLHSSLVKTLGVNFQIQTNPNGCVVGGSMTVTGTTNKPTASDCEDSSTEGTINGTFDFVINDQFGTCAQGVRGADSNGCANCGQDGGL